MRPSSVVNVPSETPLERMNFSFANGYQLRIASWLGWRPCPLAAADSSQGISGPCLWFWREVLELFHLCGTSVGSFVKAWETKWEFTCLFIYLFFNLA